MEIYFGETFKKLRKEHDLTQEQAADIFRVSPQAVSRWECQATYPDITLLPVIADYFKISMEELLGTEQSRKDTKIQEYIDQFKTAMSHGLIDDCIEIARAGVKEFPNNYALLNHLMYALFVSGDDTGNIKNWKENAEKYKEEIIEIGEKILNYCTDDTIRLDAKARLGFHYCELGQLEKGRAIFETLPDVYSTRDANIYWALRGEESLQYLKEHTLSYARDLVNNLWRYLRQANLTVKEKLQILSVCETVFHSIYDENDPGEWSDTLAQLYLELKAPLLIQLGDYERAYKTLDQAVIYLSADAHFSEHPVHTSLLVQGLRKDKEYDTADSRSYAQKALDDILSKPYYDAIRETARFQSIITQLKKM